MKENYTVSFTKNDVAQARLVKAENAGQALAYFAEIEPAATVYGASLDQCNLERRGCPVEIVPDGWQPAADQEQAEQQGQRKFAHIVFQLDNLPVFSCFSIITLDNAFVKY